MLLEVRVIRKVSPLSVCICPVPWSPINYLCSGPWRGEQALPPPRWEVRHSERQEKHHLWCGSPLGVGDPWRCLQDFGNLFSAMAPERKRKGTWIHCWRREVQNFGFSCPWVVLICCIWSQWDSKNLLKLLYVWNWESYTLNSPNWQKDEMW